MASAHSNLTSWHTGRVIACLNRPANGIQRGGYLEPAQPLLLPSPSPSSLAQRDSSCHEKHISARDCHSSFGVKVIRMSFFLNSSYARLWWLDDLMVLLNFFDTNGWRFRHSYVYASRFYNVLHLNYCLIIQVFVHVELSKHSPLTHILMIRRFFKIFDLRRGYTYIDIW